MFTTVQVLSAPPQSVGRPTLARGRCQVIRLCAHQDQVAVVDCGGLRPSYTYDVKLLLSWTTRQSGSSIGTLARLEAWSLQTVSTEVCSAIDKLMRDTVPYCARHSLRPSQSHICSNAITAGSIMASNRHCHAEQCSQALWGIQLL